ncbi:MAG: VWA domain-containing protein [Granulosicoccus sp.]
MRRLPVYLLVDTSGSMRGEPIEAVNNGIKSLTASLRQDPQALESVYLSIVTFDAQVKVVCELTPLESFNAPPITTPDSGPTHLGKALATLANTVKNDVRKSSETQKGDWAPMLFTLSDGKASDRLVFEESIPLIRAAGFASIVGLAAGPKANPDDLNKFCDHVAVMETMDGQSFSKFFQWVSEAINTGNRSGNIKGALPPPPAEITVDF